MNRKIEKKFVSQKRSVRASSRKYDIVKEDTIRKIYIFAVSVKASRIRFQLNYVYLFNGVSSYAYRAMAISCDGDIVRKQNKIIHTLTQMILHHDRISEISEPFNILENSLHASVLTSLVFHYIFI